MNAVRDAFWRALGEAQSHKPDCCNWDLSFAERMFKAGYEARKREEAADAATGDGAEG